MSYLICISIHQVCTWELLVNWCFLKCVCQNFIYWSAPLLPHISACVCVLHPLLICVSYSRCQKDWHANKPRNPTLIFQFSVCKALFIGKNESRCQYRHGHTLMRALIHSPFLVESGMHITWKHFIFILRLGLDDIFRTCHISWFGRPSSPSLSCLC